MSATTGDLDQPAQPKSFDDRLARALRAADPLALRGLLYQLTGDETLRQMKLGSMPSLYGANMAVIQDADTIAMLHEKVVAAVRSYREGTLRSPQPTREHIRAAICLAVGEIIPEPDADFWLEEIAITPWQRALEWDGGEPEPEDLASFRVLLVGAGLAGMNAAIQLKRAKIPFVWLDKNPEPGGTWYQNDYPGARVDVPSRAYSHTWAVNYPYSSLFVPQPENLKYMNWAIDEFGVRSDLRSSTEVTSLVWDDLARRWKVEATLPDGGIETFEVNAVIAGVGFLDRPVVPIIEGADDFRGPAFHTSRWEHDLDLRGKRVAVIGTGASACQMVPEIAPLVENITIFQRTAPWMFPMANYRDELSDDARWLNDNLPFYNNWVRLRIAWQISGKMFSQILNRDPDWEAPISISPASEALVQMLTAHLNEQLADRPDLIEKCLPHYAPLAKRWIIDNGWFETLKRDGVELVTDRITRITETGVKTESGAEYEADVIVYGTGFHANDYLWPMQVVGRGGVAINDRWSKDGARAYAGIMVAGFPNFFMLYGPNTNPFANGPVVWGELQTRYALEWIKEMITGGIEMADVTEAAYDKFNELLDERLSTAVYFDKRQKSYYTNEFGRPATNGPWSTEEYWQFTRRPQFEDFDIVRRDS